MTVGLTESLDRLVPLAARVLPAMAVPVHVGSWGLREGVAAWAYDAARMCAAQDISTAVGDGGIVLVVDG